MEKPSYLYGIDDNPPFHYAILYGLQWAFIAFPSVIIAATLCGAALGLGLEGSIRFLNNHRLLETVGQGHPSVYPQCGWRHSHVDRVRPSPSSAQIHYGHQ
jgi:hypothetical protein